MSERGVFAVDRGIFDHDVFADEPFTEREAWVWLIGEAAFRSCRVRVGTARIELARGQLAHSLRFLAKRWKWGLSSVQRFLSRIEKEGMIGTVSGTGITIITICKYDSYQRVSLPDETPGDTPPVQQRYREEGTEHKKLDGGGEARAREPKFKISEEAFAFADEIAVIAGHDVAFLPPLWISAGPAVRMQMMLDAGWLVSVMRDTAKAMMRGKRDGAPGTIRYFEKGFARAHAPQLPLSKLNLVDPTPEEIHGRTKKDVSDVLRGLHEEFRQGTGR